MFLTSTDLLGVSCIREPNFCMSFYAYILWCLYSILVVVFSVWTSIMEVRNVSNLNGRVCGAGKIGLVFID